MFESTIHRYAENERHRMKVTHKMATQATSVMSEASSHVDFLPSLPDSSKCSSFNVDSDIHLTDNYNSASQSCQDRKGFKELKHRIDKFLKSKTNYEC